jgi:predicted small secreted protein
MKRLTIVSLLLIALLLAGCQSKPVTGENISVAGGSYKNVTEQELNTILMIKIWSSSTYIFLLQEISQE